MRQRYRWNPQTRKLEQIAPTERISGVTIMPDLPDFVSPVDGKVVHGRAGLREHNKRNDVTNAADFTNEWKRAADERTKAFSGNRQYDQKRRLEHVIRAVEKHRR